MEIKRWLRSNERAADQAIRAVEEGGERSGRMQNQEELTVLVEATRVSANLAMEAEARSAKERRMIMDLKEKLHDTEYCKLCPPGSPEEIQTRWHILGECRHQDLKDARRQAAKTLQEQAYKVFTQKIKDPKNRLPHWHMLFAITKEDRWVWPTAEQGVDAKSGWQESQWWGLWGPRRMDEWATDYAEANGGVVSAMAWAMLLRALQQLGWAAVRECKKVWKVFCKLRAGEDAETAATAKQVAKRARQQRWRETEQLRKGVRENKRAKAAAEKEKASRLRVILEPTRPDRPKGWTRRLTDRSVLHWGAKRELIAMMGGLVASSPVVVAVMARVKEVLSRAQKKRLRRFARVEAKGKKEQEARRLQEATKVVTEPDDCEEKREVVQEP